MMTHGSVCSSNGTEPNNFTLAIDFDTQQASERETGENKTFIEISLYFHTFLQSRLKRLAALLVYRNGTPMADECKVLLR